MSDTKIFTFPDSGSCGGSGMLGMLAPLLQNRGLDPNLLLTMNRNNGAFGGEGGWFMWVIFLFFLMGWGGNGWGGFGGRNGQSEGNFLAGQLANDTGRELLQQAINGNGQAISQLASTLNCDVNAIQTAIQGLNTQLCSIGNQVGMSGQAVINAIERGNCQLGNQLAQCCCNIQDAVTRQGYENQLATVNQTNQLQGAINTVATGVERGFASTAYETAAQTCELKNAIAAQTTLINDKFCALEMREMQNKIDTLRTENQTLRFAESQQAQNNYLVNQLRPCPVPAYLTCSPWATYPYGVNGYAYNGGCSGCNGGCGCNG